MPVRLRWIVSLFKFCTSSEIQAFTNVLSSFVMDKGTDHQCGEQGYGNDVFLAEE
jgi:hypothetical protein